MAYPTCHRRSLLFSSRVRVRRLPKNILFTPSDPTGFILSYLHKTKIPKTGMIFFASVPGAGCGMAIAKTITFPKREFHRNGYTCCAMAGDR